jgi:hypothetical protein
VRYKHLSIADDDRTTVMPRTLLAYSMQNSLESEESWVQPARTSAPPAQEEQEIETRKKSAQELVQQARAPLAQERAPLARRQERASRAPQVRARQEQAAPQVEKAERGSSVPPVVMRADRTSSVPYVSDVDAILPDAPDPHARKKNIGLRFAAAAGIVGVMFTLGMFVGLGSTQAPPAAASQQTEAVAMVQAPELAQGLITFEPKVEIQAAIAAPAAPVASGESIELKDTPAAAPEVAKAEPKPETAKAETKASPRKWVNPRWRARAAAAAARASAAAKRSASKPAAKDAPNPPSSAEIDAAGTADALAREQLEASMR